LFNKDSNFIIQGLTESGEDLSGEESRSNKVAAQQQPQLAGKGSKNSNRIDRIAATRKEGNTKPNSKRKNESKANSSLIQSLPF
jgi:hypothetical protein